MKAKKYILFLSAFCFLFLFSFCAVCLSANKLEVDYPLLSNGIKLTPGVSIPQYLKYVFDFGIYIGILAAMLSLIIAGVMYLLSPVRPSLRESAKDRVYGAIEGFLILLLTYMIITTINPQLAIFKISSAPPAPPAPEIQPIPGVYFFNNAADCNAAVPSDKNHLIENEADLKDQKNRTTYVKIISNYFAILYEQTNYLGKCEAFFNSGGCQSVGPSLTTAQPFGRSAQEYDLDEGSSGASVTIYRKPFFDGSGGRLSLSGSVLQGEIAKRGAYIRDLDSLYFSDTGSSSGCNVPKEEQICTKEDFQKNCLAQECPTLENNIGSIEIGSGYLVLLAYFDPLTDINTNKKIFLSRCQSYPSVSDVNEYGPKQIKWDYINSGGGTPNYIFIFPI